MTLAGFSTPTFRGWGHRVLRLKCSARLYLTVRRKHEVARKGNYDPSLRRILLNAGKLDGSYQVSNGSESEVRHMAAGAESVPTPGLLTTLTAPSSKHGFRRLQLPVFVMILTDS